MTIGEIVSMKPHESSESIKNQFVAIRAIRGLCGIGVLPNIKIDYLREQSVIVMAYLKATKFDFFRLLQHL